MQIKEASELAKLNYKIHVGVVGKKGDFGRRTFQKPYFDMCKDTKIIVHCQPLKWEGDFRTFEALASGALLISDKSYSMKYHKYPLADGVHLVEYDRENLDELVEKVGYYLHHPKEAAKIAKRGQQYALKHHSHIARMNQIINCE